MYDIFFVSKKEIDIAHWESFHSIYPSSIKIENVKSFDDIKKKAFTKMFWVIWDNVIVNENFNLRKYRTTKWDDMYIHVFKNGDYFDGICLFPKNINVSQKEFDNRFFINKKEVDIAASLPKLYDKFIISNYEEYLNAIKMSTTEVFWAVWTDIVLDSNFKFEYQVPYYNQNIVHVFKNGDYFDGICLFSTNIIVSKKEFDNRFFINKKEVDITASSPVSYDIIFISYNESNADQTYRDLSTRFPRIKRIHGIKGIHQAHIKAAELSSTELFYVVDGDAIILDNFNFDYQVPKIFREQVHVWKSKNPINNLEYGYGGVKLLPKQLTLRMDLSKPDMTTSISSKFKIINSVSNTTLFNTDPFNAWKSAFRECAKLSSRVIDRQNDEETQKRLDIWCSIGLDKPYGEYAVAGAIAGRQYGTEHKNNLEALRKINDFNWLEVTFNERYFKD
jgi:hypothetical protein